MFSKKYVLSPIITGAILAGSSVAAQAYGDYYPSVPYTSQNPFMAMQMQAPTNGAFVNCSAGGGNCSFDVPAVYNQQIVSALTDASQISRDRYIHLIDDTKKSLNDLISEVWSSTGLLGIAASKQTMQGRQIDEVATAYVSYQRKAAIVKSNIEVLGSFFSQDLSSIPVSDQNKFKDLAISAKGTLTTLQNAFNGALVTINREVCKASFYLVFPTGEKQLDSHPVLCSDDGLNLTIAIKANGPLMTDEQLNVLQAQYVEEAKPKDDVKNAVKSLATITRETIESFIKVYGTEQDSNANHATGIGAWKTSILSWFSDKNSGVNGENKARVLGEEDAYNELIETFWLRSALRKSYGLPIGAFDIKYKHDKDNLDFWRAATEALETFPEEPLFDAQHNVSRDLQVANQSYLYALNAAKSKSAAIHGQESEQTKADDKSRLVVDGDFSVLDYANSIWEGLNNGTLDKWKAIHLCIQLMAADLREEMQIREQGGMKKMYKIYSSRYINIDEKTHPGERKRYIDLAKNFRATLGGSAAQLAANDKTSDVAGYMENDLRSKAHELVVALKNWTKGITKSRVTQATWEMASRNNDSHEGEMVQERMEDL